MNIYALKSYIFLLFTVLLGMLTQGISHAQIYIANSGSNTISQYDSSGTLISGSFITTGTNPYGLTLNSGSLYVGTIGTTPGIYKYDAITGTTISAPLQSWAATVFDVAVYGANAYAAYAGLGRVGEYSATVAQSVVTHNLIGTVAQDRGIFIDNSGVLYVTSYTGGTVGTYNATTGAAINASLITGLTNPWGITVDSSGNIYVASDLSGTNGYIGKYSSTGSTIDADFITGLNRPLYLALDGAGNLYETNYGSGTVGKFDTTSGSGNATFISGLTNPTGIAVTAVPEPGTCAMALSAVGGFLFLRLLRRKRS